MSELKEPVGEDGFSQENAPAIQIIMQMRIYDALMTLINLQSPEIAEQLFDAHARGDVMGSAPNFNGTFVYNETDEE